MNLFQMFIMKAKKANYVYDSISKERVYTPNTRVVLLSATPIVNHPYEFAIIFNVLNQTYFLVMKVYLTIYFKQEF